MTQVLPSFDIAVVEALLGFEMAEYQRVRGRAVGLSSRALPAGARHPHLVLVRQGPRAGRVRPAYVRAG